MARNQLTRADVVKLAGIIGNYIRQDGEFVTYLDGVTDKTIADGLKDDNINDRHVANLRVELFGRLRPQRVAPASEAMTALQGSYDKLQKDYDELALQHLDLSERFDRLIDGLKMNHNGDYRNLKGTAITPLRAVK